MNTDRPAMRLYAWTIRVGLIQVYNACRLVESTPEDLEAAFGVGE